eukprot:15444461-Alexandrium_andersonii.AAC.1
MQWPRRPSGNLGHMELEAQFAADKSNNSDAHAPLQYVDTISQHSTESKHGSKALGGSARVSS